MQSKAVELNAPIKITGHQEPFKVEVPVVRNKREQRGVPRPCTIIYTLDPDSVKAGFTLGEVDLKTESPDISFKSGNGRQYVFVNSNTVAKESYLFGFYYQKDGKNYYFDPQILNEDYP